MRRCLSVALPMLLALVALPGAAEARKLSKWRHLWATVNVCDTKRHPNQIGLRASMPGDGRKRDTLWMRFEVQFRGAKTRTWQDVASSSYDSGFTRIGKRADIKSKQGGWTFKPFDPPEGDTYVLRGKVTFQWRRGGRVVLRRQELTTGGHHVHRGVSRKRCEIRG